MRNLSLIALSLAFFVLGCGQAIVDRDAGACTTNIDCPQKSLVNSQCGITACVDGVCVPEPLDAGTPCLLSPNVWGTCNSDNACCNGGGCAP